MSWDADLRTACCDAHFAGDWNYTYNTTAMVVTAAQAIGVKFTGFQSTLDGMDGIKGRCLLLALADELDRKVEHYDSMNPSNGWGSRAGIVAVMRDMAAAVPISPRTVWRVM